MGWNPANWEIVDTIQGQEGGINPAKAAYKYANPFVWGADVAKDAYQGDSGVYGGSPQVQGVNTTQSTARTNLNDTGDLDNNVDNIVNNNTATPAYSADDMRYLDDQQSLYERMMESLNRTKGSGLQSLKQSEIQEKNKATGQQERALRNFNVQREDSRSAKTGALDKVDTNARTLSESVRRMLGMASGSGSSAYKLAAPNAISRLASSNRSDVMGSYGRNERDLDTAVGDTEVDFASLLQEIAQKRKEQEGSFLSGITQQEQGIQSSLGEIAAERARLQGGDALSASRPYQDRYMSLQDNLDRIPQSYATNFKARDLNVKTPKLSDYLVDRQAINASKSSGQSQYSPYSAFLNKQEDEEEQLV